MSMSLRENITAVIETCFSETKEEIQEVAINKILELIRTDKADRKIENCSEKPNNCKTEPPKMGSIKRQKTGLCAKCGRDDCEQKTEHIDKCNGYIEHQERSE